MDFARSSEHAEFFSQVATVARERYVDPLWRRFPQATTSLSRSVALFVEGYAFERQGRSPSFPDAAADLLSESRSEVLDPSEVWTGFCAKLEGGLNVMNNPLAPKGTPYWVERKSVRKEHKTTKSSVIEVANEIGAPLVQWAITNLREDRAELVHTKILGINGVGSKIASLFLRDVACRYQAYPRKSRFLLQPIDTWVKRSAILLGAAGDDLSIARFIVDMGGATNCEPERIDQGMWYFGAEVARSEYKLKQALSQLDQARAMLRSHAESLARAAEAAANLNFNLISEVCDRTAAGFRRGDLDSVATPTKTMLWASRPTNDEAQTA